MSHQHFIAHAILWTAAILTSAILHAPATLTTILLPCLAAAALLVLPPKSKSIEDEANGSSYR